MCCTTVQGGNIVDCLQDQVFKHSAWGGGDGTYIKNQMNDGTGYGLHLTSILTNTKHCGLLVLNTNCFLFRGRREWKKSDTVERSER